MVQSTPSRYIEHTLYTTRGVIGSCWRAGATHAYLKCNSKCFVLLYTAAKPIYLCVYLRVYRYLNFVYLAYT